MVTGRCNNAIDHSNDIRNIYSYCYEWWLFGNISWNRSNSESSSCNTYNHSRWSNDILFRWKCNVDFFISKW